jgi:hypothetical protein
MADRQDFSLNLGELNIVSTDELIEAGENFLNSDPNQITPVKRKKVVQEDEAEETEEVVDTKKAKKTDKKPIKVVEESPREMTADNLFDTLSEDQEEEAEEEEEEDTLTVTKKAKKPSNQKLPEEESEEEEEVQQDVVQDTDQKSNNVYNTISQELANHGIFTPDEGEEDGIDVNSPEELLERFQLEARKQAGLVIDKFIERFGDDYKDMFTNVFVNGVPPADYLSRYTKIENINGLDMADEGNQERVVRELYKSEGRSSEYIEKRVGQLKSYGDLADEATEAQRILIDREMKGIEEAGKRKQDELQRKNAIKAQYLQNVESVLNEKLKSKEFDGIPIDKRFADQTFSYLTRDKYKTPDNQLLTEFDRDILDLNRPDRHEMKVKVAMLMQLLKEDPTLSRLSKKAVSKKTSELFSGLKKAASSNGDTQGKDKKPGEKGQVSSWFK